jgi:hypothetical protein
VPTWLIIVLAVLAALVLVFGIGGAIAVARRNRGQDATFDAVVHEANRRLAAAHAQDKGWEPAALQESARRLYAAERPGAEVKRLELVAVRDEPGTDDDQAVFRVTTVEGTGSIWLGRRGGQWVADEVD